jgi:hypothetical protein
MQRHSILSILYKLLTLAIKSNYNFLHLHCEVVSTVAISLQWRDCGDSSDQSNESPSLLRLRLATSLAMTIFQSPYLTMLLINSLSLSIMTTEILWHVPFIYSHLNYLYFANNLSRRLNRSHYTYLFEHCYL